MRFLRYFNLPKILSDHLLGEDHPHSHRMVVGVFVMTAGVGIAKSGHVIDLTAWLVTADVIGYAVHGLGFTPYIEWMMRETKMQETRVVRELREAQEEAYPEILDMPIERTFR